MSVISKPTGMGTEANLMYEILKKLDGILKSLGS
jgi:hypothetical protein